MLPNAPIRLHSPGSRHTYHKTRITTRSPPPIGQGVRLSMMPGRLPPPSPSLTSTLRPSHPLSIILTPLSLLPPINLHPSSASVFFQQFTRSFFRKLRENRPTERLLLAAASEVGGGWGNVTPRFPNGLHGRVPKAWVGTVPNCGIGGYPDG